jgi:hypothetical protein
MKGVNMMPKVKKLAPVLALAASCAPQITNLQELISHSRKSTVAFCEELTDPRQKNTAEMNGGSLQLYTRTVNAHADGKKISGSNGSCMIAFRSETPVSCDMGNIGFKTTELTMKAATDGVTGVSAPTEAYIRYKAAGGQTKTITSPPQWITCSF